MSAVFSNAKFEVKDNTKSISLEFDADINQFSKLKSGSHLSYKQFVNYAAYLAAKAFYMMYPISDFPNSLEELTKKLPATEVSIKPNALGEEVASFKVTYELPDGDDKFKSKLNEVYDNFEATTVLQIMNHSFDSELKVFTDRYIGEKIIKLKESIQAVKSALVPWNMFTSVESEINVNIKLNIDNTDAAVINILQTNYLPDYFGIKKQLLRVACITYDLDADKHFTFE